MLVRDKLDDACQTFMPNYCKKSFLEAMNSSEQVIQNSRMFKEYHSSIEKFQYLKYITIGCTFLPVLFYSRIPILKDNMHIGVRIVSIFAILWGSNKIYTPILNRKYKELEGELYEKNKECFKNYQLTEDLSYLNKIQ